MSRILHYEGVLIVWENDMPWVTIDVMGGHGDDKKRELHAEVAKAVYKTLDIPPEWVKVQITEMKDVDHSIGGVSMDKYKDNS